MGSCCRFFFTILSVALSKKGRWWLQGGYDHGGKRGFLSFSLGALGDIIRRDIGRRDEGFTLKMISMLSRYHDSELVEKKALPYDCD